MSKTDDLSNTYLRFMSLVGAIRDLPSFPALDAVEEQVLNLLAATWATGKDITVLEAMQLHANTSATTVHRRLKTLRKKGLVALQADAADSRIKYVVPTEMAKRYFAKLAQCMDQATRSASA